MNEDKDDPPEFPQAGVPREKNGESMKPLAGHRVVAYGNMHERPLARFLLSLGAEFMSCASQSIAQASFLIDDLGLDALADSGLDREQIEAENPGLVHVSVTTFGSRSPRSGWHGGELVASAMGGTLRQGGERDHAPVKEALDACTFHADMVACAGAMAAHYARDGNGLGQHVDVSIQGVAFSRGISSVLAWQFDKRKLSRVGYGLNYGKAVVRCVWQLSDGWCFHSLMSGRFGAPANRALSDWIDESGLPNPMSGIDWLSYDRSTLDPTLRAQWEGAIASFFLTRSKADIATEGRRRGINACVVAEPADVVADPHLEARGFWQESDGVKTPAYFARIREGGRVKDPAQAEREDRPGPLAGLRVLDFSWALVGSIATKCLGDLGADVIKIESRKRPCLSRLDVQVSVSRPDNLNDKPWFAHLNTSKRSVSMDIKRPEARELLDPLIDWADVVVENFSPGTMARLGLDYDRLAARNPGIVMVSGSVYGQTGPLASEWGVDGTGGALSSRTFLTGWPDRGPSIPGSVPYGDVIVPYVMVAACLAALQRRRERGRGAYVDVSMYEVCVQQMRDALMAAQTGARPQRLGNADPGVFFQDVFPTQGDDRWVAIAACDAAQLATLHSLAGGTDIAAWTARQRDDELAAELRAAGLAAAVVQDIEDLLTDDPVVTQLDALIDLNHTVHGTFGHVNTPIRFSRDGVEPFRAPEIGEHTASVAETIGGLDDVRIRELIDNSVLT